MKFHSGDGKPWADSMLQKVTQFYTITMPCVVHSSVRYEYMIVWRWSYYFNIQIYIVIKDWVIYKFTKEIILILYRESHL